MLLAVYSGRAWLGAGAYTAKSAAGGVIQSQPRFASVSAQIPGWPGEARHLRWAIGTIEGMHRAIGGLVQHSCSALRSALNTFPGAAGFGL